MEQSLVSPRILRLSWGRLEVEGFDKPFKDAKLYPGGARIWDWRETGTDHAPGIQSADVRELLERGATVVILSRGFYDRLRVCEETLDLLAESGAQSHVLNSKEAAELYNRLREEHPVGALIHSTC